MLQIVIHFPIDTYIFLNLNIFFGTVASAVDKILFDLRKSAGMSILRFCLWCFNTQVESYFDFDQICATYLANYLFTQKYYLKCEYDTIPVETYSFIIIYIYK